ncbi:MAG: alpha/beta hydrolase [Alphaproteobacteria bacterium]|nr:alpha/beta hydrolase [Alphaproteobacteria bacterium]
MSKVGAIGAVTVVVSLATAAAAFSVLQRDHPAVAWAALLSVIWLPGLVMAVGTLVAAAVVKRRQPADSATTLEWGGAFFREWLAYLVVFVWRQPFRWRAHPDPVVTVPTPTVVLVHGYVCNRGFWHPWMRALKQRGWTWRAISLEPVLGDIDEMVDRLDPVLQQAFSAGAPVAIVAHSMGGLVTRAWLARQPRWPDGLSACVTIGSPHRGTWVARLAGSVAGRQMREDSPWIAALSSSEPADRFGRFLCWRSLTDHVVYPPDNASLPGATNRVVRCAGHVDLAFQPAVMTESLDWVASAFSSSEARTRS